METNDMIIRYLHDYVRMDNPQYAVLLNGKWGCGKTYFIKNLIQQWTESTKQISDETITLKPIYISLNGVSTIRQVTHLIKRELCPLLYSKGAQIARNVIFGGIKTLSKGMIDVNGDGHNDDLSALFDVEAIVDILLKPNDIVCGQKILIFDDLERCKIPTDEIFGYINNFVEHAQCKVILIGEETKIQELYANNTSGILYKDFKEKLIGQTFIVNHSITHVIDSFLDGFTSAYLTLNKILIVDFFHATRIENLRILKQCFTDFERLFSFFDLTKYTKEIADEFAKQALAYFIVTYCEYKSGHVEIESWQDYRIIFLDEEAKNNQRNFDSKYDSVIARHNIRHSSHSITPRQIVQFISTGYVSLTDLNDILAHSSLDKQGSQESDWETLWQYQRLENTVFENVLARVENLFYNETSAIQSVPIVLHISLILLNIGHIGIKKISKRHVLAVAKRHIDRIYKQESNSISQENLIINKSGAWGLEYRQRLVPKEANELFDYAQKCIEKKQEQIYRSTCKTYWETLDNKSLWDINEVFLRQMTPKLNTTYNETAILKYVSPRILASRILKLSNRSKEVFGLFLHERYGTKEEPITIKEYHIDELSTLEALQRYLQPKLKQFKLIDKIALAGILEALTNSINQVAMVQSKSESKIP